MDGEGEAAAVDEEAVSEEEEAEDKESAVKA